MQSEENLVDIASSFFSDIPLLLVLCSYIPELSLLERFDFIWAQNLCFLPMKGYWNTPLKTSILTYPETLHVMPLQIAFI